MNKDNIYILPYSNCQYMSVKQLKEECLEVKEYIWRGGAIIFHLRNGRNNKKRNIFTCIFK